MVCGPTLTCDRPARAVREPGRAQGRRRQSRWLHTGQVYGKPCGRGRGCATGGKGVSLRLFPLQTTFAPPRQSLAGEYRDYYVKLGKFTADGLNRTLEALPTAFAVTSQSVPLFTDAFTQVIQPELNKALSGQITGRAWADTVRPAVEALIRAQG